LHIVTRGKYLQWFPVAFCRDFLSGFSPLAFGEPTPPCKAADWFSVGVFLPLAFGIYCPFHKAVV
jgi:hypothetical protein